MAFDVILDGDNKQRINLSNFALNIIYDDMLAFGNKQFTNFINTVISNFKYESDASISFALEKEKQKLEDIFESFDKHQKDKIIEKLLDYKKQELTEKFSSYEKFKSCPVRLWKETVEYLTDSFSDCKEERYYKGKIGNYLKAIIEDYASKSFRERELIYFFDRVKTINTAIKEKRGLALKTSGGTFFFIYPYKIVSDQMLMYNYLIGYSQKEDEDIKRPITLRISRLSDIKLRGTNKSLKDEEIAALEDSANKKGVQFLGSEERDVVVKLTENGKRRYINQLHLRPECIEIRNGDEYVFRCTPAQAEFYFVKFGKDALIKEPLSLRDRMLQIYKDACDMYESL